MRYRYDIDKGIQKLKTKTALAISGVTLGIAGLVMAVALPLGAHASPPQQTDLSNNNWRVFNGMPATNSFWDINKAQSLSPNGVWFPFQRFQSTTTGSFAIYLENNYNNDLSGQTITANVNWSPSVTNMYVTRGAATDGAYVRLEFQDTSSGTYNSNDYWWSTGNTAPLALDLNAVSSGTLTASLSNCTLWSNQSGKSACDTETNWQEWQGDTVAQSPADGFAQAAKNVKQVSLSFGRGSAYASGVAAVGTDDAVFNMTRFTIQ